MLKNNRRRIGVITASVVCIGLTWWIWPQPSIGPRNFHRIREGMSPDQVEAIIGLPPGDYYTPLRSTAKGPVSFVGYGGVIEEVNGLPLDQVPRSWEYQKQDTAAQDEGFVSSWKGEDYAIYVAFDESRRAMSWHLVTVLTHDDRPGFLARLRQWLGR